MYIVDKQFQIFGQQDRYVRSLVSPQLVGRYTAVAKVHLPPNDYSYSDTGMFYDEDSCRCSDVFGHTSRPADSVSDMVSPDERRPQHGPDQQDQCRRIGWPTSASIL